MSVKKTAVLYHRLRPGDKFWFKHREYMKVSGPAPREEKYAVSLQDSQLTFFYPSEKDLYLVENVSKG